MRVLVTGAKGQLGKPLMAAFAGHELLGLDLPETDITHPATSDQIADWGPEVVVHAAAYTDVDGCEQNPDRAFLVNAVGTQHVAVGARRAGATMIHISTNEVFDGLRREPYREWDATNPTSVYARSKGAAEQLVRDLTGGRFSIVRIAWLFGPDGNNFVTKIIAGAQKHGALSVAADEFGNPTYAPDLAVAIAKLAAGNPFGIYHLTNEGFCSRLDFAREILRLGGLAEIPIKPILSAQWPRPSRPPLHALLANTAGAAQGLSLRTWQAALAEYLKRD